MRILITNVYSWKNKGDAAIVISLLEDIKSEFPEAKISISSLDPEDIGRYGKYKYYNNILNILRMESSKFFFVSSHRMRLILSKFLFRLGFKILHICILFNFYPYRIFPNELVKKIKSYKKNDLIIACGGGYLLTTSKFNKLETILQVPNFLIFAYDFYMATLFNKPYVLYNQSIGPFFSKSHFLLVKPLLKKAKIIYPREKLTYERLKQYGLNNIALKSDAAFNLNSVSCDTLNKYSFKAHSINIGITVRKWLDEHSQKNYEHQILQFITKKLEEDPNIVFYFMPQVIYEKGNDNDINVSLKIKKMIPQSLQGRVFIITDDLHPSNLKYIIGKMDYFIGTRMHSNIFALESKVKTIAIAYEPKTIGIMDMLGLSSYVIRMEEVTEKRLTKLFIDIKNDKEYINKLSERIPEIKKLSKSNISSIISF